MATTTGVKLEGALRDRLKALGELKDRSAHWMMKCAIKEYVDREERIEAERLEDEARWLEFEESGRFVRNSQVNAWLDSIGAGSDRPCPR